MRQPRGRKTARRLVREELLSLAERYWSHVHHEPNTGCWFWDGATTTAGYGQLWIRRGARRWPLLAHRVAFALVNGAVEAGADLLHSCDTPLCCNPAHLREGDQHANNADIDARNRRRRGAAHPRHGKGVMATLTAEQVVEIRECLGRGERVCDLAREFGVVWRTVARIKNGESWSPFTRSQEAA